jgi:hypothetical protein
LRLGVGPFVFEQRQMKKDTAKLTARILARWLDAQTKEEQQEIRIMLTFAVTAINAWSEAPTQPCTEHNNPRWN